MSDVALITASYGPDFESCRLLCESIDTYVTGHTMHYLVVPPRDVPLFSKLAGPRRQIVNARELLHAGIRPLRWAWRGRRYFWAPWMTLPIYGWHLQQFRKIAMTLEQPSERVIHVDSDNCFCRPFDARAFAGGDKVPLQIESRAVNRTRPHHVLWWRNAHKLLGLTSRPLPGDDFVGQVIVWDKHSLRDTVNRIEATTHRPWIHAMARVRNFSEYMLYGVAVTNNPELMARHEVVIGSPCLAYWEGPALNEETLPAFAAHLAAGQCVIAVQSFTHTPLSVIRQFALGTSTPQKQPA